MPEFDAPIMRVSADTGCAVGGPSCLECTFSEDMCVFELPVQEQKRAWFSHLRAVPPEKVRAELASGKTAAEVARDLGVSYTTVRRARAKSR